ncbi:MAG: hypothetical protein IJR84_09190 [Bacteroidaceae bacterium]|nr:hypothetical protein [Bacteroidaceae bacterium]
MTTSEDIAIMVRSVLIANCPGLTVSWQRHGYEQTNEVVIVPHMSMGESSIRTAVVKVNIHVPDIYDPANTCYETDLATINTLKKQVIDALKRHVEENTGINWRITSLDPAIKEPDHNEHFASVNIEAYIRERN